MPIYDLSYRHWEGALHGAERRWFVIAEAGVRLLLSYKKFVFLLMLSWVPFFVQAFMLYMIMVKGASMGIDIGAKWFQIAYGVQVFPLILVTIYAGSGLIASDLAANALPLYFSKPITRRDYILGKLAVIAFFLTLVFVMPIVLLFVFAAGVSPDMAFIKEHYWVILPILGYGLLVVATTSLFIVGLSSTSRSGRVVGVAFIAVVVFSDMIANLLSLVLRNSQVLALSPAQNLVRLSDFFFMQESGLRLNPMVSLVMAGLIIAWSLWTLNRRIRPVEVVA